MDTIVDLLTATSSDEEPPVPNSSVLTHYDGNGNDPHRETEARAW